MKSKALKEMFHLFYLLLQTSLGKVQDKGSRGQKNPKTKNPEKNRNQQKGEGGGMEALVAARPEEKAFS